MKNEKPEIFAIVNKLPFKKCLCDKCLDWSYFGKAAKPLLVGTPLGEYQSKAGNKRSFVLVETVNKDDELMYNHQGEVIRYSSEALNQFVCRH